MGFSSANINEITANAKKNMVFLLVFMMAMVAKYKGTRPIKLTNSA